MLRFWMLRTFDALIVTPMRGSFLPLSYRSIHQPRGVFSTVLLKSVAVCFYAFESPRATEGARAAEGIRDAGGARAA